LPPLCSLFYTIELLRALDSIHAAGVLHADLKPDNIVARVVDCG